MKPHDRGEIWRAETLPQPIAYAGKVEIVPRTHSGFGLASAVIGAALLASLFPLLLVFNGWPLVRAQMYSFAGTTAALVGFAFAIPAVTRKSKRRRCGLIGMGTNVLALLGFGFLLLVSTIVVP